ncbi:hypothetical protein LO80_07595 [Candidatus Francisella endociliophora]|uniref:Lipoprotein n=1 Tax=Candidatus Francisella endociliophora TaxID=653937 RepID=A0A097EQK6_9GAMM|nr:hypothetical protein [Francisella sp. FSC1006]AIT09847.1 hypothetical protein LO80_07595 [Francisella sp. FSC1006]
MKKTLALAIATILLAGCINYKNDSNNLDGKVTIDTSTGIPEFVAPASFPASQAIAYNFSLSNGSCSTPVAGNADGSLTIPAPTSGDTYRSDDFNIDNAIFAFAGCSSGTIINISFNGGKTLSYTIP